MIKTAALRCLLSVRERPATVLSYPRNNLVPAVVIHAHRQVRLELLKAETIVPGDPAVVQRGTQRTLRNARLPISLFTHVRCCCWRSNGLKNGACVLAEVVSGRRCIWFVQAADQSPVYA